MKNLIIILLSCLFLTNGELLYSQKGKELDNEYGTSMMPIVDGIYETIQSLEDKGYEIVRIEYDLIFQTRAKETIRGFAQNYKYGILAIGDYRVEIIGLNIYTKRSDGSWEFLRTGQREGNTSSVVLEQDEWTEYKIEVVGGQFVEGYEAGHYALFIFHD
jgi:hypothetical protein